MDSFLDELITNELSRQSSGDFPIDVDIDQILNDQMFEHVQENEPGAQPDEYAAEDWIAFIDCQMFIYMFAILKTSSLELEFKPMNCTRVRKFIIVFLSC